MITNELLDYIKLQFKQGVGKEQIASSLLANGWKEADINEAFVMASSSAPFLQSPLTPQSPIATLPGGKEILSQALSLYKQRLGTFLGVATIPVLVSGGALIAYVISGSLLLMFIFSLIAIFCQLWGQISLIYAIKDSQDKIGVAESYRRGWHKIFSYLWVSLLLGLITAAGFIFFIIPGIIFAVWFSLAVFVLVAENLKGMDALLKSREYVRGKWGYVFWRFFFIGALSIIITLILLFVLGFTTYGEYVANVVISIFFTPLILSYSFLLYFKLRDSKGEIASAPPGGRKSSFIGIAIFAVVIIIVPIFMIIALNSARGKAFNARREVDIRQIQIGLEIYYSQNKLYPFSLDELLPQYLPEIPVDPKTNLPYEYQRQGDSDYQVCALLTENTRSCVSSQSEQ